MNHQNYAVDMYEAKQVDNTLVIDASNTETVEIQPYHRRVIAFADADGGGAYTVKLPYAAKCKGITIEVGARITGVVAVSLQGQSAGEFTTVALDTNNDRVLVQSDGDEWHTISNKVAS